MIKTWRTICGGQPNLRRGRGNNYINIVTQIINDGIIKSKSRDILSTITAAEFNSCSIRKFSGACDKLRDIGESIKIRLTPKALPDELKENKIKRYLYSPFTFDTNVLLFDALAKFIDSNHNYDIVFANDRQRDIFLKQLNEDEQLNKSILQAKINALGRHSEPEMISRCYDYFKKFIINNESYIFEPGEEGTIIHVLGHGNAGDDRLAPSPYARNKDCKYSLEIIPQLKKMQCPANATIKLDFCWSAAGQRPSGNSKEEFINAFHAGNIAPLVNYTESSFFEDFIDELKLSFTAFCGEVHAYFGSVLAYRENTINERVYTGIPHFAVAISPHEGADEILFRKSEMRVIKKM